MLSLVLSLWVETADQLASFILCFVDTRNEVNVELVKSVYSMTQEAKNSHLLCGSLQVKNIVGHKWEKEKERAREQEKENERVRDCVAKKG